MNVATDFGKMIENSDEGRRSITLFVIFHAAITLFFIAIGTKIFPFSDWGTSSDFHACIEISSSFIALVAAISCLMYYFGLRNRYFLIIGLGFFICGSEDLIHGILSFKRLFEDSGVDFSRFIPGTYVAGRSVLAVIIIAAALLESRLKQTENVKREAAIFSIIAIVIGSGTTALAFKLDLPRFIYPERVISRPVDFISAILFMIAFVLILKRYLSQRDIFSEWLLACILLNIGGQIYMSFSKQLFDVFFDTAHWANILSYLMPVLGISIQSLTEMRRSNKEVVERKRTEKALQESEERFKTQYKNFPLPTGTWQKKDGDIILVDYNLELEKKTQGKIKDSLGITVKEFYQDNPEIISDMARCLSEKKTFRKEIFYTYKSTGIERDLFVTYAYVPDDIVMVHTEDITDRRQAEEELKKSMDVLEAQKTELEESNLKLQEQTKTLEEHRRLQEIHTEFFRLLNSIESSFIADKSLRHLVKETDSQLGLIYLLSSGSGELSLQSIYSVDESVIHVASLDATAGLPAKLVESKEPIVISKIDSDIDFTFNLGFCVVPPKQIVGYPLSFRGRIFGAVILASLHEYSEDMLNFLTTSIQQLSVALNNAHTFAQVQRQSNRLRKLNEELTEASRLKSEFLANMSHELRTPLNSILGFSEIMLGNRKGNLTERDLENLNRINRNGNDLLNLINEILDLSKVEAGKMDVNRQAVDIKKLIETQVELMKPMVTEKGLSLAIEINQELPEIHTDEDKVAQVLKNLLSNAVKFTETGGITVRVEMRTRREDPIEISVVDTGIGIPPEAQEIIFEEFRQADGTTTRKYGGTGLGLSICRQFAHLLGGEIQVQSEEGVESTFTFVLPVDATPIKKQERRKAKVQESNVAKGKEPLSLTTQQSKRIVLSIDDDEDALNLIKEYVTSFGAESITTTSGLEGIQKARRLQPGMITLDLMMPEIDGWETLKALKSDPITSDIPVVIISILSEEEKAAFFGVVDYLTKPLSRDNLYAVLNRILSSKMGIVLVVDDEPDFLNMTEEWLSGVVDEFLTALNGKEALQILERKNPDLILLDLMMPEMDGFEFLEKVKFQRRYSRIPIVVVTAKVLSDEEKALLRRGTLRVIQKGKSTYEELKQVFNEVFEQ